MSDSTLHDNSVLIDGLIISNWSRSVFEDMQSGGVTAANCTCCVWEGFNDTMANIAQWKQWFEEYDDILLQVHTSEDIRRAKSEGKVGIIPGLAKHFRDRGPARISTSVQRPRGAGDAADLQPPEPGWQRLLGKS